MLIVTVDLLSALTGKRTNLGTLHIANVGGTRTRGDYEGRAYQKGYQPAVGMQEQGSTRKGQVKGYGRIAEPVWSLVLSMLESMGYRGGRGVEQPPVVEPRDMDLAPKDGSMLRLLVDYSSDDADHPLEDTAGQAWTIGFNNLKDTGVDEWQFAGWSWSQDCFCDGHGKPVGWLPFLPGDE
jgi:hypothetical protein